MTALAAGTPQPDGRKRRGDASRTRILQRAMNVVSTDGLDGLSIGRLAADLGMSKGNVTVLFGTKERLQIATIDAAEAVFQVHVIAEALAGPPGLPRLRAVCEHYDAYLERRVFPGGCFMARVFGEASALAPPVRARIVDGFTRWRTFLADLVRAAQRRGALAGVDAEELALELFGLQQAANLALALGDDAGFDAARRLMRGRLRSEAHDEGA
jgi:AcrR family transcriptional regulator